MPEVTLTGCRPQPLASYLSALGVLRLSSVADPEARGRWQADTFVLESALDRRELQRFFLEDYQPTPIVAPWNGGSGFYPKDRKIGIAALRNSTALRFAPYRETIAEAEGVLAKLGIREKVDKATKELLLEACRASLPDPALEWLDAGAVLTGEGAKYPPLLGTGGNDGRLEFSNNFMQRIVRLFDPETGAPVGHATPLLAAALFGEPTDLLDSAAVGQFDPGSVGGANSTSGFEGDALGNPWAYVLMLEGALLFAAAAARRMEHDPRGALSFPFTVRAVGAGYASAATDDEAGARGEIWLPLWPGPARLAEVRSLFAEGRAHVAGRPAASGTDFARAVATLGVDRGIGSFVRYGFFVRNGLAYLATPLGRFQVRHRQSVTHLQEIDAWHDRLRSQVGSAPASVVRAIRELDRAILALCQRSDRERLLDVLVQLGRCEQTLAGSLRWARKAGIGPVPPLSPEWLEDTDDGSVELRLAASLASVSGRYGTGAGSWTFLPLRTHLEPVATVSRGEIRQTRWRDEVDRDVTWRGGNLVQDLIALMARRLLRATQRAAPGRGDGGLTYPDTGRLRAYLPDVAAFIQGRVNERRLGDLLCGCVLIDWPRAHQGLLAAPPMMAGSPSALYGLLKLCFAGQQVRGVAVPLSPQILRLAAAGKASAASVAASRRLRASGLVPAAERVFLGPSETQRIAAALLFPLDERSLVAVSSHVLRPKENDNVATPATAV